MKTFLGVTLGALLLSASAMAETPGSPASLTPQGPAAVGVVSTPYTGHASGSEQMPVFEYTAPAGEPADPVVLSTPQQYAGGSEQMPVFNYQDSVPMTAGFVAGSVGALDAANGVPSLVDRHGG
ncbi:MAG: hypothetical protein ACREFZ_00475 [Acetobacteraceae bacterium]